MNQHTYLITDTTGTTRCHWGDAPDIYRHYHDTEWGRPVHDDYKLFEKICLEGFQSGLSWLTILKKRENFREAFAHFDFHKIALFTSTDSEKLLANSGIIRHRGKIEATINNAKRACEMESEFGSLDAYFWQFKPISQEPHCGKKPYNYPIPSITQSSIALSSDLKKRGWKFVGPTTAYAFMQAMGLVNDHIEGCDFKNQTS